MYQPAEQGPSPSSPAPEARRGVSRAGAAVLVALLLAVGTLLLGTARSPSATANATTTTDFAPTERHAKVARLVSSMFERSHYRQAPVNDPVSSLVLDRYLESIDGSRSYFLASDIAGIREVPLRARRCHHDRQARARLCDLQPVPAAQPRAHGLRDQAARHRAGLQARRVLRVRPRERAVGDLAGRNSTNSGASASRTTPSR